VQFYCSIIRHGIHQLGFFKEGKNVCVRSALSARRDDKLIDCFNALFAAGWVYIAQKVVKSSGDDGGESGSGKSRPEYALYTFVCKQRFDKIDKEIRKLRQLIGGQDVGVKAI